MWDLSGAECMDVGCLLVLVQTVNTASHVLQCPPAALWGCLVSRHSGPPGSHQSPARCPQSPVRQVLIQGHQCICHGHLHLCPRARLPSL